MRSRSSLEGLLLGTGVSMMTTKISKYTMKFHHVTEDVGSGVGGARGILFLKRGCRSQK